MRREVSRGPRTLGAVLLNPALRPAAETISFRNLGCALPLVRCARLRLANLLDVPSKDQTQLGATVIEDVEIARSRALLAETVLEADEILFAWGSNRVAGQTGAVLRGQVSWLRQHLREAGVRQVWMVAGTPRHPSRWRQYVGPEKARVEGSTFEDRLAKVLAAHLLE